MLYFKTTSNARNNYCKKKTKELSMVAIPASDVNSALKTE